MKGKKILNEKIIYDTTCRTCFRQAKEKSMTQQELADATGINRSLLSRLEKKDFIPSIPQLESLGECLGFDPDEAFTEQSASRLPSPSPS